MVESIGYARKSRSVWEKYRQAYHICKDLASLAAESQFEDRLHQLKTLQVAWAQNKPTVVADVYIHNDLAQGKLNTTDQQIILNIVDLDVSSNLSQKSKILILKLCEEGNPHDGR